MLLTKRNYLEKVIGTWHFCQKVEFSDIADLDSSFPFFSSVIENFFPDKYSYEEQKKLYRDINFYKRWAGMDDKEFSLTSRINIYNNSNIDINNIKKKQYIFATFHLGSYRQINNFLVYNNIPFFLVTDKNFIDNQGEKVKKTYKEAHKKFAHKKIDDLVILNAEESKVLFEMKKEFKKNKSLVVYIDGNTGTGKSDRTNKNLVEINFFGKNIYVRKGIAEISYLLNIPIIPMVMKRNDWTENDIIFDKTIDPEKYNNRKEYVLTTIQNLYSFLESIIKSNDIYDQWESWLYLHNYLKIIKPIEQNKSGNEKKYNKDKITKKILQTSNLILNHSEYDIFTINKGSTYLLNKKDLKVKDISKLLYSLLECLNHEPIPFNEIQKKFPTIKTEAFVELVEENLLNYEH